MAEPDWRFHPRLFDSPGKLASPVQTSLRAMQMNSSENQRYLKAKNIFSLAEKEALLDLTTFIRVHQ
jgi:hypothetical protein